MITIAGFICIIYYINVKLPNLYIKREGGGGERDREKEREREREINRQRVIDRDGERESKT